MIYKHIKLLHLRENIHVRDVRECNLISVLHSIALNLCLFVLCHIH